MHNGETAIQHRPSRLHLSFSVRLAIAAAALTLNVYVLSFGISRLGNYAAYVIGALSLIVGVVSGFRLLVCYSAISILFWLVGPLSFLGVFKPPTLAWSDSPTDQHYRLIWDAPGNPSYAQMQEILVSSGVLNQASTDTEKLLAIAGWASRLFSHHSSNTPSKSDPLTIIQEASAGQRLRCVEYAIVVKGACDSVSLPARTLNLKTKDAATSLGGAGRVVTEVWLPDLGKWALADGQYGHVPLLDGVPLNAVEFQRALATRNPKLVIMSDEGPVQSTINHRYINEIAKYLYYMDFSFDQRSFKERDSGVPGGLMLVPQGAEPLTVFQRKYPVSGVTYTSSAADFYRPPALPDSPDDRDEPAVIGISGLVRLTDLDPSFVIDLKYATEENFTGKVIYQNAQCLLTRGTAEKLVAANRELREMGYGLKIWDAYRPFSAQQILWDAAENKAYVADPKKGSVHNRGTAVDVTLVDSHSRELPMPSQFDDFSEKAHINYKDCSDEAIKNRELLASVMVKHGFNRLSLEWWHFTDQDYQKYPVLDVQFSEFDARR